jgi:hypothetical protein
MKLPTRVFAFEDQRTGCAHYYYRHRPHRMTITMPAPDAPEFAAIYARAEACRTIEELAALRVALGQRPYKPQSPKTEGTRAMWAWMDGKPLTARQVAIVRRALGLTPAELDQNNEHMALLR